MTMDSHSLWMDIRKLQIDEVSTKVEQLFRRLNLLSFCENIDKLSVDFNSMCLGDQFYNFQADLNDIFKNFCHLFVPTYTDVLQGIGNKLRILSILPNDRGHILIHIDDMMQKMRLSEKQTVSSGDVGRVSQTLLSMSLSEQDKSVDDIATSLMKLLDPL